MVAIAQPVDPTPFGLPANPPGLPARLTTAEVCQAARISKATLWRRIASGRLPRPIDQARQALFCAAAVARALSPPAPVQPDQAEDAFRARLDRLQSRYTKKDLIYDQRSD